MSSAIDPQALASVSRQSAGSVSSSAAVGNRSGVLQRISVYPATAMAVSLSGVMLVFLAFIRLWPTDLWDHLNYGRRILATGELFRSEPLLPLSEGMPMVNIPWLSQVILELLHARIGLSALQFAAGLCGAFTALLLGLRACRRSHSAFAAATAVLVFFVFNREELQIIRPQLAGLVCYSIVLWWVFGNAPHRRRWWIMLPLLFALWSNLHGSFIVGLFAMGTAAAGRLIDSLIRTRSLLHSLRDRSLIRTILLTQLCAAAALLNPWGPAVYTEVLNFSSNPNLASMFEWDALSIRGPRGQDAAAVLALLFFATAVTPRRIRTMEVLLLAVTGYQAAWSARMLNWWIPPAALFVAIHISAALRHRRRRRLRTSASPSLKWTMLSLAALLLCLQLNPLVARLRSGARLTDVQALSPQTPIDTVSFLNELESLPEGPIFIRAEWAGYLMNRGPAGLTTMVNLHVHAISEEVWNSYIALHKGHPGWERRLDDYSINVAILCKNTQGLLIREMKRSADWKILSEDRQAVVLQRKYPLSQLSTPPSP